MSEKKAKNQVLDELKQEFAVKQKKGLPFILASAVLWTIMLIAFLTDLSLARKNMIALCCSALLMPAAMLFGKIIGVDIFSRENPLSGLSTAAALNQLLYLPIVLWAMYDAPDRMIMLYAIAVGAHFLPYHWIYASPTYLCAAIVIPIASLILGLYFGQAVVCAAFVVFDILICLLLVRETGKAAKRPSAGGEG